ncbi:biogenesis of lysosome-related organelles complex 1 subunit 2 [Danaus plexippus]|uniref:Biogenesis of lysosome-related organelles complex 1 subunit 2 n=1 Tax=Danaus plexippus plexippus TaxID=278856 RepID=A0A212F9N4_DANPL|nr:biogenesis of lysosome-related organelles complex 1 subunit 2 [Danaus plexippus]OWR50444.1 biogenesis of lysosome-related organelles complex 1 subunit 2 [Danaus plexippus plexippus]
MSEEDLDRWTQEGQNREMYLSTSCSSFEMLDPHDPIISRLATHLFKKTNDYLQGEMSAGQDHYNLLEEINRLTITKYTDLRNLTVNLSKTLSEYNEMYNILIKPLLLQIDDIDAQVSQFEINAYRLDNYTKQLKARFKELEEK